MRRVVTWKSNFLSPISVAPCLISPTSSSSIAIPLIRAASCEALPGSPADQNATSFNCSASILNLEVFLCDETHGRVGRCLCQVQDGRRAENLDDCVALIFA